MAEETKKEAVEESPPFQEIEINLFLLNNKLNYLISSIQENKDLIASINKKL